MGIRVECEFPRPCPHPQAKQGHEQPDPRHTLVARISAPVCQGNEGTRSIPHRVRGSESTDEYKDGVTPAASARDLRNPQIPRTFPRSTFQSPRRKKTVVAAANEWRARESWGKVAGRGCFPQPKQRPDALPLLQFHSLVVRCKQPAGRHQNKDNLDRVRNLALADRAFQLLPPSFRSTFRKRKTLASHDPIAASRSGVSAEGRAHSTRHCAAPSRVRYARQPEAFPAAGLTSLGSKVPTARARQAR